MNRIKRLFSLFSLLAITLAITLPVAAIDFDAEEAYDSIFVISSGHSLGSGFAFGDNCVITNAHVISDVDDVTITTYTGEEYPAFVVAIDERLDIAVLGVSSVTFTPLIPADYLKMNVGDDVYAIGAPNSMAYTLTKGCLSAKDRIISNRSYIQTDAAINTGNSGGPLLDNSGCVIGVNSYKMSDAEGLGLAIPISAVTDFISNTQLETDPGGNVDTIITEPSAFSGENESTTTPKIVKVQNPVNIALLIAFLASGSLNIILLIFLSAKKKKEELQPDPKERTDFDIDILE